MLQLKNSTPFQASLQIFPNKEGLETLYLVAKATFDIGSQPRLSERQLPIYEADEYWGEPDVSSLKATSEFHIEKTATDILLFGLACAKHQAPTRYLDLTMKVGAILKTARVYGQREWQGGKLSAPAPFANMPLTWERSYGGVKRENGKVIAGCTQNPVGLGFSGETTNGMLAPNIESLNNQREIQPVGFGPVAPHWHPRVQFAGTYDERWQVERAPYLPLDFHPRFLNLAPEDQIYPGFLSGGEAIFLDGFHPDGPLSFTLPYVSLAGKIQTGSGVIPCEFNIETLALYPNQKQYSLTWRAAASCPKNLADIRQTLVSLAR